MSTDETQGQEAPERLIAATDDEDTEGHRFTAATEDGDDTEGHRFTAKTGDEGPKDAGVHTSARSDDEDDTEGHVKHGGA
jgi:hypothetical protein